MKLKWVRRSNDDPNAILCIYANDREIYLDLEQVNELSKFLRGEP